MGAFKSISGLAANRISDRSRWRWAHVWIRDARIDSAKHRAIKLELKIINRIYRYAANISRDADGHFSANKNLDFLNRI
jgi:hypothetical protein